MNFESTRILSAVTARARCARGMQHVKPVHVPHATIRCTHKHICPYNYMATSSS